MDVGHRDILGVDKTGHLLFCTEESVKSSWAIHTKLYNIYRGNTFPTHIMSDSVINLLRGCPPKNRPLDFGLKIRFL